MQGDRPPCECHGEPMYWNADSRRSAGGYWRCAVKKRAQVAAYYARMPGLLYQKRQLRQRRQKALRRREERDASPTAKG